MLKVLRKLLWLYHLKHNEVSLSENKYLRIDQFNWLEQRLISGVGSNCWTSPQTESVAPPTCFFRVSQWQLWRSWRDGLYLCNASYSPLLHHWWLPVPQTNGALRFVTIGPLQKAWCFALFEHSLIFGIRSRLPDSGCFLFSARACPEGWFRQPVSAVWTLHV